jgi:hypothetical protein
LSSGDGDISLKPLGQPKIGNNLPFLEIKRLGEEKVIAGMVLKPENKSEPAAYAIVS